MPVNLAPSNGVRSDRWPEQIAWVIDLLVCALTAVIVLPSSLEAITNSRLSSAWHVIDLAAVIVLHALVAFARRLPRSVFATGCAAMVALVASPHLRVEEITVPAVLVPTSLVFFYLLYVAALRCDARTALAALGVALLGSIVVSVRLLLAPDWSSQVGSGGPGWLVLTAIAVLGPVAAWALGRLRATRAAYLAELADRARRNEQDRERERADAAAAERVRIAAEMHDVVSHSLAVIVSQAEGGRMATTDDSAREVLRTIGTTGRTAIRDMRSMLGVLRTGDVHRDDPQPDVNGIAELATKAGAQLTVHGTPRDVSTAVGLAAYRIVQESLTNALKHGRGKPEVRVDWGKELELTVTNECPNMPGQSDGGSGIVGMHQRAHAAGGAVQSGPNGAQWRVTARLPVTDA